MEYYYTGLTQLRFWHPILQRYRFGIAFHEYVIDVHDGAVFLTKEIVERAACDEDDVFCEYAGWKDLSKDFDRV